jgi:hypothetical protein
MLEQRRYIDSKPTDQWITADLPLERKKSMTTQKAAIEFCGKIGYKDYLL